MSIEKIRRVIIDKYESLDNIDSSYLNDRGRAAKEAYKAILWHLYFHEDLKSLEEDISFQSLVCVPNKNPEYYKILRELNRYLDKINHK